MRVLTGSLDDGNGVCGAQAAGNWAEGRRVSLYVIYRSPEGVRPPWPHPPVAGTHSYRSTTADDSSHTTVPRWDERLLQRYDGVCPDWFEVEQKLRQEIVLSPLLVNIFVAAVLIVALQRFSEDQVILAELVHLKEPPTSMGPELSMHGVRRAV